MQKQPVKIGLTTYIDDDSAYVQPVLGSSTSQFEYESSAAHEILSKFIKKTLIDRELLVTRVNLGNRTITISDNMIKAYKTNNQCRVTFIVPGGGYRSSIINLLPHLIEQKVDMVQVFNDVKCALKIPKNHFILEKVTRGHIPLAAQFHIKYRVNEYSLERVGTFIQYILELTMAVVMYEKMKKAGQLVIDTISIDPTITSVKKFFPDDTLTVGEYLFGVNRSTAFSYELFRQNPISYLKSYVKEKTATNKITGTNIYLIEKTRLREK